MIYIDPESDWHIELNDSFLKTLAYLLVFLIGFVVGEFWVIAKFL